MISKDAVKTVWRIDMIHSWVGFHVKHLMISTVLGQFNKATSTLESEGENFLGAQVTITAQIDSIDTGDKERDDHLKSEDFFDAEKHPELSFVSSSFDGKSLEGALTIKGATRQINLDVVMNGVVVDSYGQTRAGFEVRGAISRKEYGLTWNGITETGSIIVSDTVKLVIDAQFVKVED